jgi:ubiquinone/menaquinone biosynthesis C-methylase UbiE
MRACGKLWRCAGGFETICGPYGRRLVTNHEGGSNREGLPVGDFDRVQASVDPNRFVEWMRHQRAYGADRALGHLELNENDSVVDIGCGPGADLELMHRQARRAVGVDLSEAMVKAAKHRVPGAKVLIGRATELPFANGSFDAAWARALLIHVPDAETALGEMARVLQPGGRVVLSEPDHESHIVQTAYPATFERIKKHRRSRFRNPLIGRNLPDLAVGAGLSVAATWATPIVHTSFASARAAGGPFDRATHDAVDDGAISVDEGERYLQSLQELDDRGGFLFAGIAMSVLAVRS